MKDNKFKYQNIGGHVAPTKQDVDDGEALSFYEVSDFYPDIYEMSPEKAERFYPGASKEEYKQLIAAKNNPDAEIKIYRAAPRNIQEINPGDWVATSREYAEEHGKDNVKEGYHVLEATVKASELATEGNSVAEWSYVGDNSLTPTLDLYDKITETLSSEGFSDSLIENARNAEGEMLRDEHMRESLSEHLGIEFDEDFAMEYTYHIESECLAKLTLDPYADTEKDMVAAKVAVSMISSEAYMSADPKIIEDMAEKKVNSLNPEFINEFIDRENVGAITNACDKLDRESLGRGEEDISEMSLSDATDYCMKNLTDTQFSASENSAITENAENIARFYRVNYEKGAGDEAKEVWAEKLEKVEEAKGAYKDALIEMNETIESGAQVSDSLRLRINSSGEILADYDKEAFKGIHDEVDSQNELGVVSQGDITEKQYIELQRVADSDVKQEDKPEINKTEDVSKSQNSVGLS